MTARKTAPSARTVGTHCRCLIPALHALHSESLRNERLPLLLGAAIRCGRGFRFRFIAAEPFVLESTGDRNADLVAGVTRVNRVLEELIRQAPEQYLWIHDRYRTKRAPGEAAGAEGGEGADGADGEA